MQGRDTSGAAGRAVRVLIADDDELFRAGLRAMLEAEGLDVVGEARRGEDALKLTTRLAPDVVLISLELQGISGTAATQAITEAAPDVKVVALTVTAEPTEVMNALIAGADGYLAKDESVEAVAAGMVRAAAAGEALLSARTTHALIERLRELGPTGPEAVQPKLSERELEVLRLMVEGRENAEIAAALYISPETVKHHVRHILHKLDAQNRVQAAVRAVRAGLV
jgi:NarL family two-component system response regulator LiaR